MKNFTWKNVRFVGNITERILDFREFLIPLQSITKNKRRQKLKFIQNETKVLKMFAILVLNAK